MPGRRYIPNALPDNKSLDGPQRRAIRTELGHMLHDLKQSLGSADELDGNGVYVGAAGVALTLLHTAQAMLAGSAAHAAAPAGAASDTAAAATATPAPAAGAPVPAPAAVGRFTASELTATASHLCEMCVAAKWSRQRVTFLEGKAGPLALLTVMRYTSAQQQQQQQQQGGGIAGGAAGSWKEPLAALLDMYHTSVAGLPAGECEVLYGRAGYLWALLYVRQHLPPGSVPQDMITDLLVHILNAGRTIATRLRWPGLIYQWHDSLYLGGAHGLAGILYVVMHAGIDIVDQLDASMTASASGVRPSVSYRQSIQEALQALVACCHPSGNLPSSVGNDNDKLVQWCHGAPSLLQVLQPAAQHFPQASQLWLQAARKASQVVWERGLLLKGVGLCHGISGNAYSLLSAARVMELCGADPQEVTQQVRRAEQMMAYGVQEWRNLYTLPDRPASLYEGLGGLACLVADLDLRPDPLHTARFPGFELQ